MSENKSDEEQHQQMEGIFICADVWLKVFAFLDPFELGLKMAPISDRLDALVDVHFKSRKWSLGRLQIRRADDGNGAKIVNARSGEGLPIPEGPLPNKVLGFEQIEIRYVDQSVIGFLQRIRRLFDSSGTNVCIGTFAERRSWEIIRQKIWPLVSDNICGLHLFKAHLDRLRQFSPAILRNCAKFRSIHSYGLCPEFPADDNAGSSSCKAVAKWLLTPRGDGLPKMLHFDSVRTKMDGLKESFLAASESANFIIKFFKPFCHFVVFELKNNLTGERMTFRQIDEHTWLLVRCPIAREEDKWAAWEKEAIHWEMGRQRNFIAITFDDRNIGEGLPENQIG